jgi:Helix-turn-helix domain
MKNLDRIRQEMSPERRRKIQTRARAIMAEEMTLRDLRTALARTQTTVGDILGIGQEGVSRIEHRSDLLLSTLRSYVEAMGGNLSLIVEFPDREPVALSGIGFSIEKGSSAFTARGRTSELRGKRAQRALRTASAHVAAAKT